MMLTGSKSRQYQDEVLRRLEFSPRALQNSAQKEIKLCYVTVSQLCMPPGSVSFANGDLYACLGRVCVCSRKR